MFLFLFQTPSLFVFQFIKKHPFGQAGHVLKLVVSSHKGCLLHGPSVSSLWRSHPSSVGYPAAAWLLHRATALDSLSSIALEMCHPWSPTLGWLHEATVTSKQLSGQLRPSINTGAWWFGEGLLPFPISWVCGTLPRCPQFYFPLWCWSFQFSMSLV